MRAKNYKTVSKKCQCGSNKKNKNCCEKNTGKDSRPIPPPIAKILREEVGFGCPIENCGNPYLEYHHFNPTWKDKKKHIISGMIALCPDHHRKADKDTYTVSQLNELKKNPHRTTSNGVNGKFDWMRNDLLIISGGNSFLGEKLLTYSGEKVVWFTRDKKNNYLLLNVDMFHISNKSRLKIENSNWIINDDPEDVISPPSGKLLHVKYSNGDFLKIEFSEIKSETDYVKFRKKIKIDNLIFPITIVEIEIQGINGGISFKNRETNIIKGNIDFKISGSRLGGGIEII